VNQEDSEQNEVDGMKTVPTEVPKTHRPLLSKISNGDISAMGHLIHYMFGSKVGFSVSVDRMALFPIRSNPIWWP